MSGHRRQVIESWLESLDTYGVGQDHWIPTTEHFAWLCRLALQGLDASSFAARDCDK